MMSVLLPNIFLFYVMIANRNNLLVFFCFFFFQTKELAGKYHLAITGKSWACIQEHYPELVARCAVKGTIFARMSPDQKQQLIQELQHLGYVVGKLSERFVQYCYRICEGFIKIILHFLSTLEAFFKQSLMTFNLEIMCKGFNRTLTNILKFLNILSLIPVEEKWIHTEL